MGIQFSTEGDFHISFKTCAQTTPGALAQGKAVFCLFYWLHGEAPQTHRCCRRRNIENNSDFNLFLTQFDNKFYV